jgi:hypothetical protein
MRKSKILTVILTIIIVLATGIQDISMQLHPPQDTKTVVWNFIMRIQLYMTA